MGKQLRNQGYEKKRSLRQRAIPHRNEPDDLSEANSKVIGKIFTQDVILQI